ncbi:hypothetical protein Salat_1707800 [Sesamum alatum]|uniref:Uncharacterized protein n=1 Tax=Sesamum alatum TaxID=300844 RepID=A0AAE1Y7I9_9LAMI|nr:hypothetical protein Salat_1707800 [Sesamum alatum]
MRHQPSKVFPGACIFSNFLLSLKTLFDETCLPASTLFPLLDTCEIMALFIFLKSFLATIPAIQLKSPYRLAFGLQQSAVPSSGVRLQHHHQQACEIHGAPESAALRLEMLHKCTSYQQRPETWPALSS